MEQKDHETLNQNPRCCNVLKGTYFIGNWRILTFCQTLCNRADFMTL